MKRSNPQMLQFGFVLLVTRFSRCFLPLSSSSSSSSDRPLRPLLAVRLLLARSQGAPATLSREDPPFSCPCFGTSFACRLLLRKSRHGHEAQSIESRPDRWMDPVRCAKKRGRRAKSVSCDKCSTKSSSTWTFQPFGSRPLKSNSRHIVLQHPDASVSLLEVSA